MFKMILYLMILISNGLHLGLDVPQIGQEQAVVTFEDKDGKILATGSDLSSVQITYGENMDRQVTGKFKDPKKLEAMTHDLIGETLSIYGNDELIISVVVSGEITSGDFTISGGFTLERAKEVAELLKESME